MVLSELSVGGRIASFLISRGDLLVSCPRCLSTSTSKRKHRTSPGYRTFFCSGCGRRFNERTGKSFNDLQFAEMGLEEVQFQHFNFASDEVPEYLAEEIAPRVVGL